VWVSTNVVPGFKVRGFWDAVVVAAVFGVLNAFIGWFVTVVLILGTLGLGLFFMFLIHWVANAVVLQMTAGVTSRVRITGFGSALLASAIISLVGTGLDRLLLTR